MAPCSEEAHAMDKAFLMLLIQQDPDFNIKTSCIEVAKTLNMKSETLRLLLCIIDVDTKPDWTTVSAAMGNVTAEGCRQKFYKLKRESEALYKTSGDGSAVPVTPATKKARATPKSTGTGKGKGKRTKADVIADNDDDNAEADDSTPVKKPKVKKEQSKGKVKVETSKEDVATISDDADAEREVDDDNEVVD